VPHPTPQCFDSTSMETSADVGVNGIAYWHVAKARLLMS